MSKKMNKLVLLSALMIAIIGTFGTVSADKNVDLIAGGGNVGLDVGNVTVWNNSENIYVIFTTTDGWCMTETHLHIATLVNEIPQTKKNNPIPGKFENSTDYDPCTTTSVEYSIPIPDGYEAGDDVIIAAHAAVQMEVEDGSGDMITYEESAWGEGVEFNDDRNWAMYFTYTIA